MIQYGVRRSKTSVSSSLGQKSGINVNQSKFIFLVITQNYNVVNAIALERLPEKQCVH